MKNLEVKVGCTAAQFAAIRERSRALGESRVLRQRDAYFAVPTGRLKLREIESDDRQSAELIGYSRPDSEGTRYSTYHRIDIAVPEVPALIAALESTIGVRVIVAKEREVVIHRRTRIHLDRVENLGYYVELETVMADGDTESDAESEIAEVMTTIGIDEAPAIAGSYSDLLEAAGAKALRLSHAEVSE
jgi:predicted adenylyl cyclase CyaB